MEAEADGCDMLYPPRGGGKDPGVVSGACHVASNVDRMDRRCNITLFLLKEQY